VEARTQNRIKSVLSSGPVTSFKQKHNHRGQGFVPFMKTSEPHNGSKNVLLEDVSRKTRTPLDSDDIAMVAAAEDALNTTTATIACMVEVAFDDGDERWSYGTR
jgi:hypothetical protein